MIKSTIDKHSILQCHSSHIAGGEVAIGENGFDFGNAHRAQVGTNKGTMINRTTVGVKSVRAKSGYLFQYSLTCESIIDMV
ncbi:hypothetical protein [Bacillus pumilus]